jgi:FKBP-type peptidyl-prolyl cis-trans isomerase
MKVTKKKIDDLQFQLSIAVAADDYAANEKKKLADRRRTAEFKGFRKGMVPMSLIQRVYGDQALVEAVNEVVSHALSEYITKNNITAKPTKSGLYIIVNKKGDGPKVATGKKVSVNYTGRLLDGTLFDTSREADAREAKKYQEGREYGPMTYTVGSQPMIKGWEEGVMGQPAGSDITLVMPSELAYGARGAGRDILPYSPLVFNLTIESVE